MPRERWFFAQDNQRKGPVPLAQLVESLLTRPDPRRCLVWHHGLPAWTPAGEVPDLDRRLAPHVAQKAAPAPEGELVPPPEREPPPGTTARLRLPRLEAGPAPARPSVRPSALEPAPSRKGLVYGAAAAVVVVVGVAGWLLWPKPAAAPETPEPSSTAGPAPPGGTSGTPAGGPVVGGRTNGGARPGRAQGFTGWSDAESDLPAGELSKLRGVAGWSGTKLSLTLYNGSAWRVTELLVRTSRFSGDQFVDDDVPYRLVPPGAPVDQGVAQLLNKVAPDRKRPGLNPLDTGPFEAKAAPQPENYHWRIEGARGYPPRLGS